MILNYTITLATLIVAFAIKSVDAQHPCPPVPELATVVDTPEKCTCFWSLAQSGFVYGNSDTYKSVFEESSVQNFPLTGEYIGYDGISEYLSWVKGGESGFVKDYILIGQQLILDMTGTTMGQCVMTFAERRRLPFNSFYLEGNTDMCVDVVAGSTIYYTMTGKNEAPITIHKNDVYLPGELISRTFPLQATPATAEFVCDTIINICGYNGTTKKSKRVLKKGKKAKKHKKGSNNGSKKSNAMQKCLKTFKLLPDYEIFEDLPYIDGDTKGCRILHSVFAANNSDHCPHVSFEADEDINGFVKCNESKKTPFTDLFTEEQIELFHSAYDLLGLPTGFELKLEACPGA